MSSFVWSGIDARQLEVVARGRAVGAVRSMLSDLVNAPVEAVIHAGIAELVSRVDQLVTPGAVNTVLTSTGSDVQWVSSLTLVDLTLTGTFAPNMLALAGGSVSGAPTWSDTQTLNTSGNAATATLAAAATVLANARTLWGVSFNGSANITAAPTFSAGATVSNGQTLALGTSTITGTPTWGSTQTLNTSGLAATATALATPRTINGTSFDGTANITVTAAAGTLTGTTLAATVVTSSLTSLGTQAADLKFTDASFDIGKTGATRPRDFFLSRNATIGGTLGVTGDTTVALLSTTQCYTVAGTTTCANATATTIYTTSFANGAYLVSARGNSIGVTDYSAFSICLAEGTGLRQAVTWNGNLMTITVSGSTIKVTQTSGVSLDVVWSIIRLNAGN